METTLERLKKAILICKEGHCLYLYRQWQKQYLCTEDFIEGVEKAKWRHEETAYFSLWRMYGKQQARKIIGNGNYTRIN